MSQSAAFKELSVRRPQVAAAIRAVMEYMWEDEREDCEERYAEGHDPGDHIFDKLVTLHNFVYGTAFPVLEFLDVEEDAE